MSPKTLSELAKIVGGRVSPGGEDFIVDRILPMHLAGEHDLTFLTNPKYKSFLAATRAGAVLLKERPADASFHTIETDNPQLALARILTIFYPPVLPDREVSDGAKIHPSTAIGEDARIGSGVVIGKNAVLGDRCTLFPGVVIGDDVVLGDDVILYPNVVVYHKVTIGSRVIIHAGTVIGSDGFGFVKEGNAYIKVPQIGDVVIEDDVEIGAGCTIDRGSLGRTIIRQGVKLDNLIHVAHNVEIGRDTAIAAQTGISGSTTIGERVTVAGQVGFAGHIKIGDDCTITGKCGVTKSVHPGVVLSGYPPMEHRKWLRLQAVLAHAMEMKKALEDLKRRFDELEKRMNAG